MRALVSVDRFQVHHVADHLIFRRDPIAAMHVARGACYVERLADIVAFDDRDHIGREPAFIHQAAHPKRGLQTQRNIGEHVSELLLVELSACQRPPKLLAVETILPRGMHTKFSCAHRAPADAIARAVEASERPFKALHIGQQCVFAHMHIIHHDPARGRGAQRDFTVNLGCGEPLHAFFKHKASDAAAMLFRLCPDDENVCEGRVGNPRLRAVQDISVSGFLGSGFHASGV